jgi:hypothetical protein
MHACCTAILVAFSPSLRGNKVKFDGVAEHFTVNTLIDFIFFFVVYFMMLYQ